MNNTHTSMDIITLLNNKNTQIKNVYYKKSSSMGKVRLTFSELKVLLQIAGGNNTIAKIARTTYTTRQAMQKKAASLYKKDLICTDTNHNNRRDKKLMLTLDGNKCIDEYNTIINEIENNIKTAIGNENYFILKDILNKQWQESII